MGHGAFPKTNANLSSKKACALLPQILSAVSPVVLASLLLAARGVCEHFELPAPDVAQILAATETSRSTAYETMGKLVELLPTLARPRGRPPKPLEPSPSADAQSAALTRAVLAYVMRHAGCVHRDSVRQQYSDGFRHFILEQRHAHEALTIEAFAAAVEVPLGTLKEWLRPPSAAPSASPSPSPSPEAPPAAAESPTAESLHLQTVLDAWRRWHGGFGDFCAHVRHNLLIPFGSALISHILAVHGERSPARRTGRRSDEIASRGSFITFFAGAQWVGDGMQLPVVIDDQRFSVNFELDVDAHTGAFVGLSIRDEEDSTAVIDAFREGVTVTGSGPLAVLLDNRPSNHTAEVETALGDSLLIRATVERPQNKGHVEGAFGLFSRALPELVVDTRHGPRALARSVASIATRLWARTMNNTARSDRNGRPRVELYEEPIHPDRIEDAKRALREIAKRQERSRRTLEQRRDPIVLNLLDEHFARLDLTDPKRYVRIAIAGYPMDAILAGLSIFDAKKSTGTLPLGADARYLLGIVRNVADTAEGEQLARTLLDLRLDVRDRMLAPLRAQRDPICVEDADPTRVANDCVDRALATTSTLVRMFWLDSLACFLRTRSPDVQRESFRVASRRIDTTFAVAARDRQNAVRVLAEQLVALA
jgi:hypothetical protein